jgi:hypothetical protein
MLNRMAQRMYFVTGYYGLFEGVLSIPRLFWGNLVNFLANWRAIVQIAALRRRSPRGLGQDDARLSGAG